MASYENTIDCWQFLCQAGKHARYLDYVPASAFDDRRNGEPIIYRPDHDTLPHISVEGGGGAFSKSMPSFPGLPWLEIEPYRPDQPYHLEIWAEKSTMNDVLVPICQSRGINLIVGLGEISITHCLQLVQRVNQSGCPCRIFYISDFDPAGQSMPVAAARKIEFYTRKHHPELDICLYPIILTADQCEEYQLPRTPIKKTERRAGTFEARHGSGATELDALEALHPGEMKKIILDAVDQYYDHDLGDQADEWDTEAQDYLSEITDNVIEGHEEEIEALKEEYEIIRAEMEGKLTGISERIGTIWHAIHEELHDQMPGVPPLPEGEMVEDIPDPLLDTARNYLDQIKAYRKFKEGKP